MATTVESLSKAIGKKKQSMAFAWLADLMRQRGDLDGAQKCAESGLAAFPESLEGKLVLSKILEEKQDYDGVVETLEFVLIRNSYCLSALRRIGDAYAAKGDEAKRNHYYQMLHDLDPLDTFWKDEYAPKMDESETVDPLAGAAAGAAVAEPSLDDLLKDEPLNLPVDETSLAAEESPFEKAPAEEESPIEKTPTEEVEKPVEPVAPAEEDDPFASFASLAPADEDADGEVSFNDLEHSLDDAIAGFAPTNTEKDVFPTDEIEGNDISSALSGIFGATETEEKSEEISEPAAEEPAAQETPAPVAESAEKPQTLSDAFDDIFGEDELPEEFIPNKPAAAESTAEPLNSATESPVLDQLESLELPQETQEETPAPAPNFDLDLDAAPAEEKSTDEKTPEPAAENLSGLDLDKSVDSSFDSLFGKEGDDELKEESLEASPFEKSSAESVEHPKEIGSVEMGTVSSVDFDETPEQEKPETEVKPEDDDSLEGSVDNSFDSLFGKEGDDELQEEAPKPHPFEKSFSQSIELPKDDSAVSMGTMSDLNFDEKPAIEKTETKNTFEMIGGELDTVELDKSVGNSFDNLFGKAGDDELSENLTSDKPSETTLATEAPALETPAVSEANDSAALDLDKSVDSSFDNLFGKNADDDLPLENLKLDEKPTEPAAENPSVLDLDKSVDSSFENLFGKDSTDDLLDDSTTSTRTLAEIYFGQGVYDEALKIYKDLLRKSPDDAALSNRLAEIEKIRNDKLNQD